MLNKAFTLAEILITLGIIGLIAALTIPELIANHRKEVLKNEFIKTYKELQQINLSLIKDEDLNMNQYAEMLNNQISSSYPSATQYFSMKMFTYYPVNAGFAPYDYKNTKKDITNLNGNTGYGKLEWVLDDAYNSDSVGRTYYFNTLSPLVIITVDVNGYRQLPNQFGIDIFSFIPLKNGTLKPLGDLNDLDESGLNKNYFTCSYKSGNEYNGVGCAYWASIDRNPDDKTKTYWKNFIKY